jgi:NAD(P)-dependent dehydrogenase (short-subunit alcohol dehydrogenase family)
MALFPDLEARRVLITGGATGIGAAMVRAFAAQRAEVAFIDVDVPAGTALADDLARAGHAVRFFACDLTDTAALHATIADIHAVHGTTEVLINNAARDDRHVTAEVTSEDFDRLIAVNLKHVLFATQAVLPAMVAASAGVVLTFSSISWMTGSGGLVVYTAAKSAMLGLTRSIARDYGVYGIRANAIAPGWIETPRQRELWITPEHEKRNLDGQCLKRWIQPEEVAAVAVFLASESASAITAQHIVVDGGRT